MSFLNAILDFVIGKKISTKERRNSRANLYGLPSFLFNEVSDSQIIQPLIVFGRKLPIRIDFSKKVNNFSFS